MAIWYRRTIASNIPFLFSTEHADGYDDFDLINAMSHCQYGVI